MKRSQPSKSFVNRNTLPAFLLATLATWTLAGPGLLSFGFSFAAAMALLTGLVIAYGYRTYSLRPQPEQIAWNAFLPEDFFNKSSPWTAVWTFLAMAPLFLTAFGGLVMGATHTPELKTYGGVEMLFGAFVAAIANGFGNSNPFFSTLLRKRSEIWYEMLEQIDAKTLEIPRCMDLPTSEDFVDNKFTPRLHGIDWRQEAHRLVRMGVIRDDGYGSLELTNVGRLLKNKAEITRFEADVAASDPYPRRYIRTSTTS